MENINFGVLGFKIGEIITFKPTGERVFIASEGGGTLVTEIITDEETTRVLSSLKVMTKKLKKIEADEDIFNLWYKNDKSLRAIYEEKISHERE